MNQIPKERLFVRAELMNSHANEQNNGDVIETEVDNEELTHQYLAGGTAVSPFLLKDENKEDEGLFSIFPNLLVKRIGFYRVKFSLFEVGIDG